jgi:hypothetical protein
MTKKVLFPANYIPATTKHQRQKYFYEGSEFYSGRGTGLDWGVSTDCDGVFRIGAEMFSVGLSTDSS